MPFRVSSALLAIPLLVAPAVAQDFNNLDLNNGGDGFFFYNDPSQGAAPGTNPPDFDGDFWWRVYAREAFHHPLGSMTMNGLTMDFFDTNWVTSPATVPGVTTGTYDMVIANGVLSEDIAGGGGGLNPGNIEPNFNDPNGIFLQGADLTGALTNPCLAPGNPLGCVGACPAPGNIVGYTIGLDVTNGGTQPGITLQADGTNDLTFSVFAPGGMSLAGGSCGNGDYILQDLHSTNQFGAGELQSDILGTGYSKYGGFHPGGVGLLTYGPDNPDEVYAEPLEFAEPVCEPMNNVGLGAQTGLAALNPSAGGGLNTLGMRYWSASAVGELAFFFASTFPLLPNPGIPIFDINILVNIADPLAGTIAGIWAGFIAAGGAFGDDGIMDAPQINVPPILVGFTLAVQGFNFDLISDFDNSQAQTLAVQP